MNGYTSTHIVLRFRDLVTELGGTISEHRRLIRRYGHVWWGWWRRQAEHIPKATLGELFPPKVENAVPIILFDSGTLHLYKTHASRVVVSPSVVGIQTPEFGATPEYYVRGNYPVWFRLEGDILPSDEKLVHILAKPTKDSEHDRVPVQSTKGVDVTLESLRDDQPTLWLAGVADDGTQFQKAG